MVQVQLMPSSSKNIYRYTPTYIFEGLNTRFDLDPCAPVEHCPSKDYCNKYYTEDGLEQPWTSSVWLNPPWTRGAKRLWVSRLYEHHHGIALVRGGVDSKWLHDNPPDALFLLKGRVQYIRSDAKQERYRKGGAVGGFEPSMLLAYGGWASEVLCKCSLEGLFCYVK